MHPAIPFAVTYGPQIAGWVLRNPGELGDAFERISRPIMRAVTDPTASIDRIGSTLVSMQGGQTEVIGLLHQHTARMDGIAAAVDDVGLSVGQVGEAVGGLTALTMVGLGFSALSQAHIAFQFARVNARLDRMAADVKEIHVLAHADLRGAIEGGLAKMKAGMDKQATAPDLSNVLLQQATNDLTTGSAKLGAAIDGGMAVTKPEFGWLMARLLVVSVLGEAASFTRLGQPDLAVQAIHKALAPLQRHARTVFERTVGSKPAAFLIPALAPHGITLEGLAELYRQAGHAGLMDQPGRPSAAELFEQLRGRMAEAGDPRFRRSSKVERRRIEFAEAMAAVEEINRLQGLALALDRYGGSGREYLDLANEIMHDIQTRQPEEGARFAVFPETVADDKAKV